MIRMIGRWSLCVDLLHQRLGAGQSVGGLRGGVGSVHGWQTLKSLKLATFSLPAEYVLIREMIPLGPAVCRLSAGLRQRGFLCLAEGTDTQMKRIARMSAIGTLLVVMAGFAVGAETVPSERRLPPNTQLFFSIPDVETLKERWDQTVFGDLQRDPALADFREQLKEKLDEASDQLKEKLGLTLDDLQRVPSGEVCVAVVETGPRKLAGVFLIDFGDELDTIDTLIEKAEETLKNQGTERSAEDIENTEVVSFPIGEQGDQELAYFVRDSMLVVAAGDAVAACEAVLVRWDGKSDRTFDENEFYRYILESCQDGGSSVMSWYVDPVGLATAAINMASGDNAQAQLALGFLPALGVTKFRAMGGAADLATPDFDAISRTFLYVDQPASGVINLFQFPEVEQAPPKWVPADVTSYVGVNWDVSGAFGAVKELVDMFQGGGALDAILDRVANEPAGPKLHLKKDFIDLLSGRIHVLTRGTDSETLQPMPKVLVAMELVQGGPAMEDVLAKIGQTPGFPGEIREFRGSSIYELTPPGGQFTMGLTAAQGSLLITNDMTLLEEVIRGSTDALVDSDEYRAVAEHFPSRASLISYNREDQQLQSMYEGLRNVGNAGGEVPFDLSTLPPFEEVKKYLAPSGGYAVPDKRGALIVSFTLKPER